MKRICLFAGILYACTAFSQEADTATKVTGQPVEIFTSDKAINATTTKLVGKGKMDFNVVHHFGDIAGSQGGISNFFGLDNATDFRIAFELGLSDRLDLTIARYRGASLQQKIMELNLKYLIAQQRDDNSHPLSVLLFANIAVAASKSSKVPNTENYFEDFGSRTSNCFQLVVARRFGNVSLQLNPTVVTRGYNISYDQKTIFALGGAIRFPLSRNLNFIVDYFHPFRSQESKDSFRLKPATPIRFYDPLGVGLEIIKGRHAFHLNFTNSTEILENRFIPRTVHSWGKGQFRWGFTISRQFTVWKAK